MRNEQLQQYILGATADDYESIESLRTQAKHIWPRDAILPDDAAIEEEVLNLIEAGLVIAYRYDRTKNIFAPAVYVKERPEDFWFLAARG